MHSSIGASGCKRWFNCPGSVRLIESLPERSTASIHTATGTVAHGIAEEALRSGKFYSHFIPRIGEVKIQDGFEVEITEDMLDAVFLYVDTIRKDLNDSNWGRLFIEHAFHLKHLDEEAYGTCDACIAEDYGKLQVYDFKYGFKEVDAEDNHQMMYYALGALELGDFQEVEMTIIQPNGMGEKIKRAHISIGELETFLMRLELAIAATRSEKPDIKQGDWCGFCAAKLVCPAVRKTLADVGIESFDEFRKPQKPENGYTPEQVGEMLPKFAIIKAWMKEVEALAFYFAERGENVKGHKLVKSWGNRVWLPGAEKEILKLVEKDDAYSMDLRTPAQLEKKVGKEFTKKWTTKPDRGTKLVPVAEKGEEVEGEKTKDAIDTAFDDLLN